MSVHKTAYYSCDKCQNRISYRGFSVADSLYVIGGEIKEGADSPEILSEGHYCEACVAKALGLVSQTELNSMKAERDHYKSRYDSYDPYDGNYGNPPRVR